MSIREIRALTEAVLADLGVTAEVGIHLVSAREMAQVNWDFLRHEGSTDVITFDHGSTPQRLHGELFISVADAVKQAGEFGTAWTEELARYVIHALLHLHGYDDLEPAKRRVMKREENRLVRRFGAALGEPKSPEIRP
ncbi:MAG TPA: rRNA maturation RNase YbeY [Candidatus Limnocylindria bacterium]|nr:rRNA maturation RNase YbeY [Candidatus Limnocylindria bacterium]